MSPASLYEDAYYDPFTEDYHGEPKIYQSFSQNKHVTTSKRKAAKMLRVRILSLIGIAITSS